MAMARQILTYLPANPLAYEKLPACRKKDAGHP